MQWKDISGYDGYYEVSSTGKVRSKDRIILDKNSKSVYIKGRLMKQSKNTQGYLVVNLRKNHTSNVALIHRLVANAFIDNPDSLPTINHKDGDKLNNRIENLEWVTYTDNNIHALKLGLRNPRGCKVVQFDDRGNVVSIFKSVSEASRETGIGRGVISHCINGRTHSAGRYIWTKIEECNDYPDTGSTVDDELPSEAQGQNTILKI